METFKLSTTALAVKISVHELKGARVPPIVQVELGSRLTFPEGMVTCASFFFFLALYRRYVARLIGLKAFPLNLY